MTSTLQSAMRLAELLEDGQQKVVLAESCTGGMVAAELTKVPGVSRWLCGSTVTYRSETKSAWLGVSEKLLREQTAVCADVAEAMTEGVLRITPEAAVAVAITGHLGPQAPPELDGVVFIGMGVRQADSTVKVAVERCQLTTTERQERQSEAAQLVLARLLEVVCDS